MDLSKLPKYCPRGHNLHTYATEEGEGLQCDSAWHQWWISFEDLENYEEPDF